MSGDAEARLGFAVERLERLRRPAGAEWEAAGCRFVQAGSRGVEVEDVRHKVLRLQEKRVK
jgi:hypothetical protein